MKKTILNKRVKSFSKPLILFLAKEVTLPEINGEYLPEKDTWSNRNYDLASSKKHNEDM